MKGFLYRLRRDTKGATAIEYGLIIALVMLAIFSAVAAVGTSSASMFSIVDAKFAQSISPPN